MARAFTDADAVQHATDTLFQSASPATPTLPDATTEGRGGVIVIASTTIINPPAQWHTATPTGTSETAPQGAVLVRAGVPAGETSWSFTAVAGSPSWAWVVEEWTNLSYAPLAAAYAWGGISSFGALSHSTGSTGAFDSLYVAGIAMVQINSTAGGTGWPSSASWSNGFTETDVVTAGPGTGGAELQLRVARRYGTPADSGPWETTVTVADNMTGKSLMPSMVVFRAENYAGDI